MAKKDKFQKAKEKGAILPYKQPKLSGFNQPNIKVSFSEKRVLEAALRGKLKDVLHMMDGYASCVEKLWINLETKELTSEGKAALAASFNTK